MVIFMQATVCSKKTNSSCEVNETPNYIKETNLGMSPPFFDP